MTRQPTYELTHCPVCDSLESVEVADAEAMRAEVELLWAFHEGRLRAGVPPDQLVDRLAFSQRPPVRLGQCTSCTHIYRNPWERKEALKAAYADASPELEVLQTLFETQRGASQSQVHRLTAVAGRAGRGLEVGSYAGGFLAAARETGWSFEGVDVNEAAAEFAARKGLAVTQGEIGDVASAQPFDAIAIWNTFERVVKWLQRLSQTGWSAPWVEIYAKKVGG